MAETRHARADEYLADMDRKLDALTEYRTRGPEVNFILAELAKLKHRIGELEVELAEYKSAIRKMEKSGWVF